jgi:hypothetical protein
MSRDLYFIPILAAALKASNVEQALHDAFGRIRSLGRQPPYRQGLLQFEKFMQMVDDYQGREQSRTPDEPQILASIVALATDTFEGTDRERQTILKAIASRRHWNAQYGRLLADIEQRRRASAVTRVSLLRDGKSLGSVEIRGGSGQGTVGGVAPGLYALKLDSGRVIWEGSFGAEELLWARAFPGQPLPLAADMGERRLQATRGFDIFSGEITVQVFAGPESGTVEITVRPSGTVRRE